MERKKMSECLGGFVLSARGHLFMQTAESHWEINTVRRANFLEN